MSRLTVNNSDSTEHRYSHLRHFKSSQDLPWSDSLSLICIPISLFARCRLIGGFAHRWSSRDLFCESMSLLYSIWRKNSGLIRLDRCLWNDNVGIPTVHSIHSHRSAPLWSGPSPFSSPITSLICLLSSLSCRTRRFGRWLRSTFTWPAWLYTSFTAGCFGAFITWRVRSSFGTTFYLLRSFALLVELFFSRNLVQCFFVVG